MRLALIYCVCFLTAVRSHSQIITTFAGNGSSSSVSGDGGMATNASINGAAGGVFDEDGNYYVCDVLGHRIRKISPDGLIETVAGTGIAGYSGDGGPATAAKIGNPSSIVIDNHGDVIFSDQSNFRIRKIDHFSGFIHTIAGTGVGGYNGDNMPATSSQIWSVEDICIDKAGNILLADQANNRIRKIDKLGIITTVAGHGGFSATGTGDGGQATAATFNMVSGLAVDATGQIYVADMNASRIRKIDSSNMITAVAGSGGYTYTGDNLPAISAQFNPLKIVFDKFQNLIIADRYNKRVLKIDKFGILHNIVGNGTGGYAGDGGPAILSSIDFPAGLAFDTCGNLFIAESNNRRVRKVAFNPDCVPMAVKDAVTDKTTGVTLLPNPTTGMVTLTTVAPVHTLAIYNLLGQVVLQKSGSGKQQQQVDVSALPPGVYVVRVNEVWTARLVKE